MKQYMTTKNIQNEMCDVFYTIKNIISNIYHWFVNFPSDFKRSVSWFFFMWNNKDWDYNYLWLVMIKKLKAMAKLQRKYGIAYKSKSIARSIDIAVYHLEQLYNDKYEDVLQNKHTEKYGDLIWEVEDLPNGDRKMKNVHCKNCTTPEMIEEEKKDFRMLIDEIQKIRKWHLKQLSKAIEKHSQYWWD